MMMMIGFETKKPVNILTCRQTGLYVKFFFILQFACILVRAFHCQAEHILAKNNPPQSPSSSYFYFALLCFFSVLLLHGMKGMFMRATRMNFAGAGEKCVTTIVN
jgi:hypothetical protein